MSGRALTADSTRRRAGVCQLPGAALHSAVVAGGPKQPGDLALSVFLALQAFCEDQEIAIAQGHDCISGLAQEVAAVSALLDASPWQLHPRHGWVLAADIEALDGGLRP